MVTGPVSRMQFYRTFECLLIDQAGPLQLQAPKAPYYFHFTFLVFHCIFKVALWHKKADISNTSDLISDYEWTSLVMW